MGAETMSVDTFLVDGPAKGNGDPGRCHLDPCTHPDWWNHRLCHHCNVGDHHLHTGVGCYGCPAKNHPRRPGIAGLGDGVTHGAPKPGGGR